MEKNPEIAEAYQKVIEEYLEKNYIRQVQPDEPKPTTEWLLPHFPVVRADRTTTKTRIVFDASAKFRGKSLNSEALPGPKLQADMLSILIRFRKELVALVGDISQMYHQLVLTLADRPLHRFLWRNSDQNKEPEVYEFLRYVFGGCYCPFCAQYVWQKHADDHKAEYPLPKNHIVTNLIVKYHHETEGHEMGVNFTLNHLREKYFVVQGRQQVKRCIKECAECNRRFRAVPQNSRWHHYPQFD